MRPRFGLFVAAACLTLTAAAAAQSGSAPSPSPGNDDCLACHGDGDAKRGDGRSIAVDAVRFGASAHGPMACVDCHTDLARLTEFPHADKLAPVKCASCHDEVASKYRDSIHAYGKEKVGLVVAPACADCHGTHEIKSRTDAGSRVHPARVPETCGGCHAGIKTLFDTSVHAAALKTGRSAPSCADCHTAHSIQRVETDGWRSGVTRECGTCHVQSEQTFRDSFHGQMTSLGFVRVAMCADCHSAHDIHAARDARSTVSSARLVETCQRCHKGADASFVQYDPHADRHNRARSPALYYAGKLMDGLLLSVFGFFGLHSTLWLARGLTTRKVRSGDSAKTVEEPDNAR